MEVALHPERLDVQQGRRLDETYALHGNLEVPLEGDHLDERHHADVMPERAVCNDLERVLFFLVDRDGLVLFLLLVDGRGGVLLRVELEHPRKVALKKAIDDQVLTIGERVLPLHFLSQQDPVQRTVFGNVPVDDLLGRVVDGVGFAQGLLELEHGVDLLGRR